MIQNQGGSDTCSDSPCCPVCFCDVDIESYRLQVCGHLYCKACLLQQISAAERSKSFPIVCSQEDCNKDLVIKDLNALIDKMSDRQNLTDAAVGHYATENPSVEYCPSPNCSMIYMVSSDASTVQCPLCNASFCGGCQAEVHERYSCEAWKNRDNNDMLLLEWAKGKQDVKKCTKCFKMIEKNGGCMHVNCPCGAHLCWRCMQVFLTSGDCYDHLGLCRGICRA